MDEETEDRNVSCRFVESKGSNISKHFSKDVMAELFGDMMVLGNGSKELQNDESCDVLAEGGAEENKRQTDNSQSLIAENVFDMTHEQLLNVQDQIPNNSNDSVSNETRREPGSPALQI